MLSVRALAEPIRAALATVGPGWPTGSGPVASFAAVRDHAAFVSAATSGAWDSAGAGWAGPAADAASETTAATIGALDELGRRAARLGAATARASDAVADARARLQQILDDFEAYAAGVDLDAPGAEDAVRVEAERAVDEATKVVDELRTELDDHAAAVSAPGPVATVPASAPSGVGGFGNPAGLGGLASGAGMGAGSALGAGSAGGKPDWHPTARGGSHPSAHTAGHHSSGDAKPPGDPGMFGSGVSVSLPDGSTATAPNAAAASAVRNALTQLGVPYSWGGTTPGVGLDCSGLTQWAYHQAGVDLPRLAQEQDIGAPVARDALRPGDLAVWDGHVAMIVGNGTMIEAGDPVKLSPIRTTNAGQGFQGFWRPTA